MIYNTLENRKSFTYTYSLNRNSPQLNSLSFNIDGVIPNSLRQNTYGYTLSSVLTDIYCWTITPAYASLSSGGLSVNSAWYTLFLITPNSWSIPNTSVDDFTGSVGVPFCTVGKEDSGSTNLCFHLKSPVNTIFVFPDSASATNDSFTFRWRDTTGAIFNPGAAEQFGFHITEYLNK